MPGSPHTQRCARRPPHACAAAAAASAPGKAAAAGGLAQGALTGARPDPQGVAALQLRLAELLPVS